ncbi:hypothetical protein ACMU_13690 [Actibacterium mucosum KCTC 23349]|uniref:Uncharacterized protein n=2 Tax=Actibacterium TaxID=1433986 RepID=A0A037ZJC5_9RHOB|nr:hypothetical protein ACMU_13690 [Actibacterium mucosum KCTC 23349]
MALSVLAAHAAFALPSTPWQQAEMFAVCSGRLSALSVHEQANRKAGHAETEAHRQTFEALLEATMPAAIEHGVPENQAGVWRSNGWVEIAGLLADANYSMDAKRADRAEAELKQRIATCRDMVL